MYNHELTLIGYTTTTDELGQQVKTPVERTVLCKLRHVGGSDFYNAAVSNLKPERKFIIHAFEYEDESEVRFEGQRFRVLRTFGGGSQFRTYIDSVDRSDNALKGEEVELTCERMVGRE